MRDAAPNPNNAGSSQVGLPETLAAGRSGASPSHTPSGDGDRHKFGEKAPGRTVHLTPDPDGGHSFVPINPRCDRCGGEGTIPAPCPDKVSGTGFYASPSINCLVAHFEPCPECAHRRPVQTVMVEGVHDDESPSDPVSFNDCVRSTTPPLVGGGQGREPWTDSEAWPSVRTALVFTAVLIAVLTAVAMLAERAS